MNPELPPLEVVAGALLDVRGRILIAERPAGREHAGRWEFPGGKRRPGEAPAATLARELREELGVEIEAFAPLLRVEHRYPGATRRVSIEAFSVTRWRGEPRGLDGQRLHWCERGRLLEAGLLEADRPLVVALWLPSRFARVAGAALSVASLEAGRERSAWIVEAPPDGATLERLGVLDEPLYLLDPMTPLAPGIGALWSGAQRLKPVADRFPAGCVVHSVRDAELATERGADFLLVRDPDPPATLLAALGALGRPWYLSEAARALPGAAATGRLAWPAD